MAIVTAENENYRVLATRLQEEIRKAIGNFSANYGLGSNKDLERNIVLALYSELFIAAVDLNANDKQTFLARLAVQMIREFEEAARKM
jgi:hypothetical protein